MAAKIVPMPIIPRVTAALAALAARAGADPAVAPAGILPPPRTDRRVSVSNDDALGLSTVYRAVQIVTTATSQITFHAERDGRHLADNETSSFVKRPSTGMDNTELFEYLVLSLMFHGNAYVLVTYTAAGAVLDVEALDPALVRPFQTTDTRTGAKRTFYAYNGKSYTPDTIKHLAMVKLPGKLTGLGPIQAAQIELRGAVELRDYAALWFSEGKIPSGILTSEQVLTAADAKAFKAAWNGTNDTPAENPSGVKVLGKGTTYSPVLLKPADAQWLENQQFTTTQLARLFGVPASLMLAAVQGSSMTYANVEQDWLAFTRFTLMGYLRKIETAFSELLPRGQKFRFNVDALLRSDTSTRYQAHAVALSSKFLTDDEVRELEGRAPFTPEQRALLATAAPAPVKGPTE